LLTSDMVTFVESLLGICEIALLDCLDLRFILSMSCALKMKRCIPPPMQGRPRLSHLEQIGWI
jgi:hypothetical protein